MTEGRRLLVAWVAASVLAVSTSSRVRAQAVAPELASGTLTEAESSQLGALRLRLAALDAEQADTSTVAPWAVLALGITATVVGVALGVGRAASCDDSCSSPFWPAWLVVGGATVSTAGLLWLRLVHEDIAELQSRRFQVQMQIDGYETLRQARIERATLHVRAAF